ncbi:MAG TPA: hypothetical protein VD993_04550 [Chitinophagaceae bacterium]|nr:hypothetical protein [Chitinophagaceae bacterium]
MGQHAVNIVYPINGEKFPKIDPACKLESAYFAASFGVTCSGGPHTVKWGFNGNSIGSAEYYDEFSAQFTWKLPSGIHSFFVSTDCGDNKIEFEIG